LPEIVKDVKKNLGATEGFGTMVFNAAGARAKSAYVGIEAGAPAVAGLTAAGVGAGVAYRAARNQGMGVREALGTMRTGTTIKDGKNKGKIVGGAGTYGKYVYDRGQSIRRFSERIREGRVLQAEDTDKLLTRLVESKKPPKTTPEANSAEPNA